MDPDFMNPNKKKERQTFIVADEVELARQIATQQQGKRNGGKKRGAKGTQGFTFSRAHNSGVSKPKLPLQNAGSDKSKAAPRKDNSSSFQSAPAPKIRQIHEAKLVPEPKASRPFFEQDGLRIPLFYKSGKRKTHARDGGVLTAKESKADLLQIVTEYAGAAKAQQLEGAKKKDISAWVQAVETRAFGNGPVKASRHKVEDDTNGVPKAGQLEVKKQDPGSKSSVNDQTPNAQPSSFMTVNDGGNKGKRKCDLEPTTIQPTSTAKKAKICEDQTVKAEAKSPQHEMQPQENQKSGFIKRTPKQAKTRPELASSTSTNHKDEQSAAAERRRTQQRERQRIERHERDEADKADNDLFMPVYEGKDKIKRHPLIDTLDLNPHWDPNQSPTPHGTTILDLPGEHANVVVTAVSKTYSNGGRGTESIQLHKTTIPYTDTDSHAIALGRHQQHSTAHGQTPPAPYLKPGKHGWNYTNSCWSFEGDPDLVTGVGHQVEPADAARLEREPEIFRKEFKEKYPGTLGNQWPCGCQMPWDDEDSEEE